MSSATIPGFARVSSPLFVLPTKSDRNVGIDVPENELVAFGEKLFLDAKSYRDTMLGMMDRWRVYRSWYLSAGVPGSASVRSTTYVNIIFEKVEKLTADLTEGDPSFLFTPNSREDLPAVELLNEAVPFIWSAQSLSSVYYNTVKAAVTYGTWYWKVIHDPRTPRQGAVEKVCEIPAWYIFPAPHATDPETAPWMIEVRPRSVGEIWRDYGKKVKPELGVRELFPDISEDMKGIDGVPVGTQVAHPDANNPQSSTVVSDAIPDSFLSGIDRDGMVIQKELWIRDGTMVEDLSFDEAEIMPKLTLSRGLKYPRGRVISWANGKLLYDQENPYKDGRFPYVRFRDISVPDFWYGLGEVDNLINLQMLHDDTHETIKLIHLFTALGRLVVDESTGLREDQLGNQPGEIWFTKPGTWQRLNWLSGSPPPAELYNYLSTLERAADLVTGSFDVTRGVNPSGVTAARALVTLQQAANIRIRSRLIEFEASLRLAGKLIASRVQQFWPTRTTLRIAGDQGVNPDRAFVFKDYDLSPSEREASFNLRVSAIANIAQLKQLEFQKMMLLFQLGAVDLPDLVEAADLTNEDKILAKLPALMLQRQMAQEGGGGEPGGGPNSDASSKQRQIGRALRGDAQ